MSFFSFYHSGNRGWNREREDEYKEEAGEEGREEEGREDGVVIFLNILILDSLPFSEPTLLKSVGRSIDCSVDSFTL